MKIITESYGTRLPAKIRKQANKIVNKYNGYRYPQDIIHMWDELEEIGIEVGIIQNRDFQSGNIDSITEVYYNGIEVENSKFVYQVYEGNFEKSGKYEFNMYFS